MSPPNQLDTLVSAPQPDERFDLEVSVLKQLSTATDAEIRALISNKFGGKGGGAKLARAVGISEATASVLRRGGGSLNKIAAYFGYIRLPEAPGEWRKAAVPVEPALVGYRRWTGPVKEMIRQDLANRRSVISLALDLNVPTERLRYIIKRHKLRDHTDADRAAGRLRWAEREARQRGGTLSQMTAYMQHLLHTPAEREEFAAAIAELVE